MISLDNVKKYCKNYTEIENYEEAIADTTQTWECHHRLEEYCSRKTLIKAGYYYNVAPECLIFLTPAEHNKLHHTGKATRGHKGKKHSEESKMKISEACTKIYIKCIETSETNCCKDWKKLGYRHVYEVAQGKRKTCKGYHFEFV